VFDKLVESGTKQKDAEKWSKPIADVFGKLKKGDENDVKAGLEIEQLVHVSPEEKRSVMALADVLSKEKREPTADELKLLRKDAMAVDIALFGRMLASSPSYNVEAAAQVSHALTVNRVVVEDDYFTAVDDLNKHEEDAGSAHIGETGFGSGVFYTYVCVNRTLLVENLGDVEELANRAIRALTEAASHIAPSGKQNSYASRARALYVMAEKGPQQPRQLSAAFLKPVDDEDMAAAAIERLECLRKNMDKVYGKCADASYVINVVEPGEDKDRKTFARLLEFVADWPQEHEAE
jgi:CRISPR system Cascade subunit CasC